MSANVEIDPTTGKVVVIVDGQKTEVSVPFPPSEAPEPSTEPTYSVPVQNSEPEPTPIYSVPVSDSEPESTPIVEVPMSEPEPTPVKVEPSLGQSRPSPNPPPFIGSGSGSRRHILP